MSMMDSYSLNLNIISVSTELMKQVCYCYHMYIGIAYVVHVTVMGLLFPVIVNFSNYNIITL